MLQLYPMYSLWNRRKTLTGSPHPTRANGTNKPCKTTFRSPTKSVSKLWQKGEIKISTRKIKTISYLRKKIAVVHMWQTLLLKYTGSRLQRVRLLWAPVYNEHDINVEKFKSFKTMIKPNVLPLTYQSCVIPTSFLPKQMLSMSKQKYISHLHYDVTDEKISTVWTKRALDDSF